MSYHQNPEDVHLWEQIETGSQREKAEAFGRLAELSVRRQEFDHAVTFGARSAQLYKEINDAFGEAEGLYQQGRGHIGLKEAAPALAVLDAAAKIFRANPNEIFLAATVGKQADAYSMAEQYQLAVKAYRESAGLYASCDNHSSVAELYLNGVDALMELREFDQAELMATQSYDNFVLAEDPLGSARALSKRSWSQVCQHNFEAALVDIEEAIQLIKYCNNDLHAAEFYHQQAVILNRLSRTQQVETALESCRELANKFQYVELLAKCDLQEGYSLFVLGLHDAAKAKVESVKAFSKVYSNHDDYVEAEVLLGNIQVANDQTLDAIATYERAVAYAAAHNIQFSTQEVYVDFAWALLELQNPSYALEILDRIQFENELSSDSLGRAHNFRALALSQLGQHQQAQELAKSIIEKYADQPQDMSGIYAQENLARSYLIEGNLELAIPALQLAIVRHSAYGSDYTATQLSRRLLEVQEQQAQQLAQQAQAQQAQAEPDDNDQEAA
jgi:tetratricopeptide (TPR) repeat protein